MSDSEFRSWQNMALYHHHPYCWGGPGSFHDLCTLTITRNGPWPLGACSTEHMRGWSDNSESGAIVTVWVKELILHVANPSSVP